MRNVSGDSQDEISERMREEIKKDAIVRNLEKQIAAADAEISRLRLLAELGERLPTEESQYEEEELQFKFDEDDFNNPTPRACL